MKDINIIVYESYKLAHITDLKAVKRRDSRKEPMINRENKQREVVEIKEPKESKKMKTIMNKKEKKKVVTYMNK